MKKLNNLLMVAFFSLAFLLGATNMNAQCDYDISQLTYTENNTSLYIYPWGGVTGDFLVLWREKGTTDWNNTGLMTSHVAVIDNLEECTKYDICIIEKCGPGDWSEFDPDEIVCLMTLCDCPCDSPITISPEAGAFETSAYVYANGYVDIPHYFEYWPVDDPSSSTTTTIQYAHFTLLEDLDPCRKYAYRLIVYCPEYDECPEACEVQGGAQVSEVHYFMTTGCHDGPEIGPVGCCDYLFVVDKSGSMSDADLAEAECEINNFIDAVQAACPEPCGARFAVTTWQSDDKQSEVLSDFDCDPEIDLGDRTPGGDNIGNAADQVADWLGDGTLDANVEDEHSCLHVIIYTDAICSAYDGFGEGVQNIMDAGATSVSLVAFENHGCEGAQETVEGTGGNYTETDAGDCIEGGGFQDGNTTTRSSSLFDPNDPNVLLSEMREDKIKSDNVSIYPMPFSDVINIDCILEEKSDISVEIYNSIGELVIKETRINKSKGGQTISIENNLLQGTYTYTLSFNGEKHSGKMLKI